MHDHRCREVKVCGQNTDRAGEWLTSHLQRPFFGSNPLCAVKKYTEQTYFLAGYSVPKGEGQEHFPKNAIVGKNATHHNEIEKVRTFSPLHRQLHDCISSREGNFLPSAQPEEIAPQNLPLS